MDNWLITKKLPYHFISAAGAVFRNGKILLIKSYRRGWDIPGGTVEQGEWAIDALKREIFEESGVEAVPKSLVGMYQRLSSKPGYGPLEGMTLPPVLNLTFICEYAGGVEKTSDEAVNVGWFSPQEALKMITDPYVKNAVEDILNFDGRQVFATFMLDPEGKMELTDKIYV